MAVKELQRLTMLKDVKHEACNLAKLCHPFLPYIFGICTKKQPYKIVMQFHGIQSSPRVLTLSTAIVGKKITSSHAWLGICMQMMEEALCYLHEEIHILHNDIKPNNILLTDCTTESQLQEKYAQFVLIDFGKATSIQNDSKHNFSDAEKTEYFRKYPHISPEVIEGLTTNTPSDIYSAGYVMQSIVDHDLVSDLLPADKNKLQLIINKCKCIKYTISPTAKERLDIFQKLLVT